MRRVGGPNKQAKVRHMTQIMGKQVANMVACPVFLTYSLFDRVGPR